MSDLALRKFIASCGNMQADPIVVKRPKWEDMIKNYPDDSISTKDLYAEIGGSFPKFKTDEDVGNSYLANSCAIRMSRGLNLSGFHLPSSNAGFGTRGGVMKGGDGYYYWLRVRELSKYLMEYLKKPEFTASLKKAKLGETKESLSKEQWETLEKMKGIIMFEVSGWGDATGHFTLWDGKDLIYPGDEEHNNPYSEYYYFHMKYERNKRVIQTDKISLWELK